MRYVINTCGGNYRTKKKMSCKRLRIASAYDDSEIRREDGRLKIRTCDAISRRSVGNKWILWRIGSIESGRERNESTKKRFDAKGRAKSEMNVVLPVLVCRFEIYEKSHVCSHQLNSHHRQTVFQHRAFNEIDGGEFEEISRVSS